MNRILSNIFLISFLTTAPLVSNSQTLEKDQLDALKDSLTHLINNGEYIGVSIAIVNKDSMIWTGGLGKYDIIQNQPVNENTLFWLGSVTKSFTALAIMKLVEENKFSLNTRLNVIIPEIEIENKWEMTNPVTIENLLEHTSGFDDSHFSAFANVYHEVLSPLEQIRKYQKSFISRWEPSTRFSYSNANYALLGYIIYKVTGMRYEEYLKQNILLPLGMTQTVFEQRSDTDNCASGYVLDNKGFIEIDPIPLYGNAAGGISSTAQDMAKFLQFWLNNGRVSTQQVFKEKTIDEILRPNSTLATKAGLYIGYGKGVEYRQIIISPEKSVPFFSNSGRIPGFVSNYYFNQDLDIGIFISNNTTASNRLISNFIAKYLTAKENDSQPDTEQLLDKTKISPFLGYYQANNSQIELFSFIDDLMGSGKLILKNDSLYFRPLLSNDLLLIPVTDFQFRELWDAQATCILTADKDNNPILFLRGIYYEKETTILHWLKLIGLFGTLLICLSSLIISVLLIIGLVTKKTTLKTLLLVGLPSLTILMFGIGLYIVGGYLFQMQNIYKVAYLNVYTFGVFMSTLLFGLFSVISLFYFFKSYKSLKVSVYKYYLLLLYLSLTVWLFIFLFNGWIGLRMWAV